MNAGLWAKYKPLRPHLVTKEKPIVENRGIPNAKRLSR
jgi:hypothetical protein